MPIKFRCVHCNKLLGIARRKAGTIVDCPQCLQQLIVPTPSDPDPEPETDAPTVQPEPVKGPHRLFEQDQFSLDIEEQDASTYRPTTQGAATYAPPPFAAERGLPMPATVATAAPSPVPLPLPMPYPMTATVPATPRGVVLSGSKIMMLLIVLFFVVAGAFGAGVVVGKSLSAPTSEAH